MRIDDTTLPRMIDFEFYESTFKLHAKECAKRGILAPRFSKARLRDAHYAWREDLQRVEGAEKYLDQGLDHFKQCAHLAYWLRRMAPIIEYEDIAALWEEPDTLYAEEVAAREFLARYGTEFIAFDMGFQICLYYELEKLDNALRTPPRLSGDYLTDLCHMLKFKHVSPHSLYLVYKSILLPR
jgi:hypothetical protein